MPGNLKFPFKKKTPVYNTVCPKSSDPFCIVTYYIKWVTTSWKDGNFSFLGEEMFALYDYDVLVVSKNTHK